MKHFRYIILLFVLVAVSFLSAGEAPALPMVRVGIVTDGPSPRFSEGLALFRTELVNVARAEFEVQFPEAAVIDGGLNVERINKALDRLLADRSVDMILALGIVAGNEACKRRALSKPVIAPLVVDAGIQQLPLKDGVTGVKNLNYIDQFRSLDRSIRTLSEITPFRSAALIANRFTLESIPELSRLVRRAASTYQIDFQLVKADVSAEETLNAISEDRDAVIVGFLAQMPDDEFAKLVAGINQKRLPSFAYRGKDDVVKGLFSSTIAEGSLRQLARNTAINALEIFNGTPAEKLPVAFSLGEKLTINMATARAIDISPGWRVLAEADLINDTVLDTGRQLTIKKAIMEALEANLDFQATRKGVAAGSERVKEAKSFLLPQIDIGTQATVIDEDRAEASLGLQPEQLWTGTAGISQQIYSEKFWSNYKVEQYLQTSREQGQETARLDVIQIAATAYLNVLRAKTLERIQKEDLNLTRENLERARIRVSIGAAGPEEVYRWENQMAENRRLVLRAESATLDAMTAVNRILSRPLSEMFSVEEIRSADPMSAMVDRHFFAYIANPKNIRIFGDFLVEEGVASAPELRQIAAGISARERVVVSSKREMWLPTFNLRGNVTQKFADGGAGTDSPDFGIGIDEKDDTDWTAGVFVDLMLFTSGRKSARIQRTQEELSQLRIQKMSATERIQERVLNAVHLLRASYPGISLSQDAADAAHRNLTVVTDSYTRGIKSIIDLLDAQNQALVADQGAANAVYDFLVDLTTMQRSIGTFIFLMEKSGQAEWFDRTDAFFKEAGVVLTRGS